MPFATTNYGWTLPDAGTEPFSWEPYVRTAFQGIDTTMFSKFDKAGGTVSGAVTVTGISTVGVGGTGTENGIQIINGSSASSYGPQIRFQRNSVNKWIVGTESGINGGSSDDLLLYSASAGFKLWTGGAQTLQVSSGGHWLPGATNTSDVGSSGLAIKQIYTVNSVIVTSDARRKTARPYTSAERAAAQRIKALGVVYQWNDSIAVKGADKARLHFGVTVQSVIAAFQAERLDPFRYGVVCYDKWDAEVIEHPAVQAREAVPAVPEVWEEKLVNITIRVNGEDRPAQRTVLELVQPAVPAQPAVQAREAYTETVREAGDQYALRLDQLSWFVATAGA